MLSVTYWFGIIARINTDEIYIWHCLENVSDNNIHCPPKVKAQPVLMLSCFAHYFSINKHKGMKLR